MEVTGIWKYLHFTYFLWQGKYICVRDKPAITLSPISNDKFWPHFSNSVANKYWVTMDPKHLTHLLHFVWAFMVSTWIHSPYTKWSLYIQWYNINPPPLCSSKSHKYDNHDIIYIFLLPQSLSQTSLPGYSLATLRHPCHPRHSVQRVYFNQTPYLCFSNNIFRIINHGRGQHEGNWTWHNRWDRLNSNLKDKSFLNSLDWSGLYLQVHIPTWLRKKIRFTVSRLLENTFVKPPPPTPEA